MNFPIACPNCDVQIYPNCQICSPKICQSQMCCSKNTVKVLSTRCYITANMLSKNCAKHKENNQYGVFKGYQYQDLLKPAKYATKYKISVWKKTTKRKI